MKINHCATLCFLIFLSFGSILTTSGSVALQTTGVGWTFDSLVYNDAVNEESWPSMETDNNGTVYVAYQHYNSGFGKEEIHVSRSIDAGRTWSLFHTIAGSHSLLHPSMAIDPYDNKLYIAYEEEISYSQHDIICSYYEPLQGWSSVIVDNDVENDRFPSIASDFSFGSGNYQYISYELVHDYDHRDIKVAKSTDHGYSWNNTWHAKYWHGTWWLSTMTSIATSADGDVYVACIEQDVYFAITWESVGELDVYFGSRESTSESFENHVTLANIQAWYLTTGSYEYCGASLPSIAASRSDSNILAVVYQTHIAAGWGPVNEGMDIRYFYTLDGGTNWIWGNMSLVEANEICPAITVDDQGSCFRVAYYSDSAICYKQANCLTPWKWTDSPSASNPISNGPITGSRWDRNIALASRYDGYNSWPIVIWKDSRRSNDDLYCTTPKDNPAISCPDVNRNGIIDVFDLVTIARGFGSEPLKPKWNPYCDLNHDNTIDIYDIVFVASHIGETD